MAKQKSKISKHEQLKERFFLCVRKLTVDLDDDNTLDSSILIATSKINGRKVQLKLILTSEELDFLDTGYGEVKV